MWVTAGVTATRGRYLFALSAVCHVDPLRVNELTVRDFGRLTAALEAMEAQGNAGPGAR